MVVLQGQPAVDSHGIQRIVGDGQLNVKIPRVSANWWFNSGKFFSTLSTPNNRPYTCLARDLELCTVSNRDYISFGVFTRKFMHALEVVPLWWLLSAFPSFNQFRIYFKLVLRSICGLWRKFTCFSVCWLRASTKPIQPLPIFLFTFPRISVEPAKRVLIKIPSSCGWFVAPTLTMLRDVSDICRDRGGWLAVLRILIKSQSKSKLLLPCVTVQFRSFWNFCSQRRTRSWFWFLTSGAGEGWVRPPTKAIFVKNKLAILFTHSRDFLLPLTLIQQVPQALFNQLISLFRLHT